MNSIIKLTVMFTLLCVMVGGTSAQSGSVNKPVATQEPITTIVSLATPEGDSRLQQMVKLDYKHTPLEKILSDLSKQSKVTLKVRASQKWLSGLCSTAYTNPMPLNIVLRRLASLHNLTWYSERKDEKATPIYVIHQSPSNHSLVKNLQQLSSSLVFQKMKKLRSYLQLPMNQLRELAKSDALARKLVEKGEIDHGKLLSRLTDENLKYLLSGRSIKLKYADIEESSKRALVSYLDSKYENMKPDKFTLRYRMEGTGMHGFPMLIFDNAQVVFANALLVDAIPINPTSVWLPEKQKIADSAIPLADRFTNRKVVRNFELTTRRYSDYLKALHTTLGVNVFSDSYPDLSHFDAFSQEKDPIVIQQEKGVPLIYALGAAYQWGHAFWQEGTKGNDFLFLAINWYEYRDEGKWVNQLRKMKEAKKKKESFSLEDYGELLSFSDFIYKAVLKELHIEDDFMRGYQDPLLFYQSLRSDDRKRLIGQGIGIQGLNKQQEEHFRLLLESSPTEIPEQMLNHVRLYLEIERKSSARFVLKSDHISPAFVLEDWNAPALPTWLTSKTR